MVIAYHLVFSTYGFWLPNDPRGSGSDRVWGPLLISHGPAKKVRTSRSVASKRHDHAARLAAKESLLREPVRFTGIQARAVGEGFCKFAADWDVCIYACAILPNHVHLVVARHRMRAESLIEQFKRHATTRLLETQLHPFGKESPANGRVPTAWGAKGRHIFLDCAAAVRRCIGYANRNPVEAGLPPQRWRFVQPFEKGCLGWKPERRVRE
jgi:REP element-mobilizing transposase RayT